MIRVSIYVGSRLNTKTVHLDSPKRSLSPSAAVHDHIPIIWVTGHRYPSDLRQNDLAAKSTGPDRRTISVASVCQNWGMLRPLQHVWQIIFNSYFYINIVDLRLTCWQLFLFHTESNAKSSASIRRGSANSKLPLAKLILNTLELWATGSFWTLCDKDT